MTAWVETLDEPSYALDPTGLDNLELLLGGLYGPSREFCLPDEGRAGVQVELTQPVFTRVADQAIARGALLFTDVEGTPLARLTIRNHVHTSGEQTYLAGPVTALQPAEHGPARKIRLSSPLEPEGQVSRSAVVAVFSRAPRPHEVIQAASTAQASGAKLYLVAMTAGAERRDPKLNELLNELERCAGHLVHAEVRLLVVPQYARGAPAGDRTVGAIVIANLGAKWVLDFTDERVGEAGHSGNQRAKGAKEGLVVLFTGLSGSGKSTLARALSEHYQRVAEHEVILLDGDDVRRFLTAGLGFSREDRNTNVERIGWVASLVARSGGAAICAPIAPFNESRQRVREFAEAAGRYVLVHVATPLEVCERRDRKGLYAKARAGLIPDFTGIDSPYDTPHDADYVLDTSVTSVEEAVSRILEIIARRGAESR